MAEKSRLKEPDEIFSSLGKQTPKQAPILPTGEAPSREEGLVSRAVDKPDSPQDAPAPVVDRRPLDFGKYALPGSGTKKGGQKSSGSKKEEAPKEQPQAGSRKRARSASARLGEVLQGASLDGQAAPAQTAAEPVAEAAEAQTPASRKELKAQARLEEALQNAAEILFQEEEFFTGEQAQAQPEPPPKAPPKAAAPKPPAGESRGSRKKGSRLGAALQAAADVMNEEQDPTADTWIKEDLPAAREARNGEPRQKNTLSEAFAQAMSQMSDPPADYTPPQKPAAAESPSRRAPAYFDFDESAVEVISSSAPREPVHQEPVVEAEEQEPVHIPVIEEYTFDSLDEEEDVLTADSSQDETESFFKSFRKRVKKDEEVQTETFKDTLTEKFMRERERYLKEFGIDPDEPPPPPEEDSREPAPPFAASDAPKRRVLNFDIQPEMHTVSPPKRKHTPVTYGPGGNIKPLDGGSQELPYQPLQPDKVLGSLGIKPAGEGEKKSNEELILELAAITSQQAQRNIAKGSAVLDEPEEKPFHFELKPTPDELPKKEKGRFFRNGKIMAGAAVVTLAALALVVWPLANRLGTSGEDLAVPPESNQDSAVIDSDTLTVYESRSFDNRAAFSDVLVRRSGISLKNMSVENSLLISDIDSTGELVLQDISVGGRIYLQTCGVDTLDLQDVKASRVIISNDNHRVTLKISGDTEIGTLELKTPTNVEQQDLEADAIGVENLLMQSADEAVTLDVKLSGVGLHSLVTTGSSIIDLAEGSTVTSMTTEGSFTLSGDGSVHNLSAGAGGEDDLIRLRFQDASVVNLSLKAPAALDMSTTVDTMAVSDALSVGGTGSVGTITLSPPNVEDGRRLPLDFSGVVVGALVSNTQSKVDLEGTSSIGTLTCNESVYTTGNKVGHLVVNANDVVYQNEPDNITIASGINPPQPSADAPNLDLDQTTEENEQVPTDVSEDDVATTCNHTRDLGGFIKGDGSRSNPFEVSTAAQLAHVAYHLDSHFVQTGNIDVADDSGFASGFTPIAANGSPFTGSYNGSGFTISGVRIRSEGENVGLFAENTGTIQNVRLLSGEIVGTASSRSYVGAIVGMNYDGGVVENCSNGALVTGQASSYVGGIVGYNFSGKIRDCYNYAKITGEGNVGGIAGVNRESASISNCYNAGNIVGQLDAGGIAGTNATATIANCYYLDGTAVTGIGSGSGNAVQKTDTELSSDQMVADLRAGNDGSMWAKSDSGGSYKYPILDRPVPEVVPQLVE